MHHHKHHHSDEHCCCCHSGHESCCHEGECSHSHDAHSCHEQGDFAHQLIEMADEAWMQVLMEKIKEQIISTSGDQLDQLAKMVTETNRMRWKHKMAIQKDVHSYQAKLRDFFNRD